VAAGVIPRATPVDEVDPAEDFSSADTASVCGEGAEGLVDAAGEFAAAERRGASLFSGGDTGAGWAFGRETSRAA
jgi:hypothetical protein